MYINERMYSEEEIVELMEKAEQLGYTGQENESIKLSLADLEKFVNTIH